LFAALASAAIGYFSIATVREIAANTDSAQRQALIRSDRVAAYSAYVEDLERHRLLLSNSSHLAKRQQPDGTTFYRSANTLIPELAADEKRIRLIASPETVEAMDALRQSRLVMYNQFVCNVGLQSPCRDYPRASLDESVANLEANREIVDDAINNFVSDGREEVGDADSTAKN